MKATRSAGVAVIATALVAIAGCSSPHTDSPDRAANGGETAVVSTPTQEWRQATGWTARPRGVADVPAKSWSLRKRSDNGTSLGVYGGKVLDAYNPTNDHGFVRRIDPRTGKPMWRTKVDWVPDGSVFDIVDRDVVALGYHADVDERTLHEVILSTATGKVIWSGTLPDAFGPEHVGDIVVLPEGRTGAKGLDIHTGKIRWHTTEFPLLQDGVLVAHPGGGIGVLDPRTGTLRWSRKPTRPPHTPVGQRLHESTSVVGEVLFAYGEDRMSAYAVQDGKRLWSKEFTPGSEGFDISAIDRGTVLVTSCSGIHECSAEAWSTSDGHRIWSGNDMTNEVVRVRGRVVVLGGKAMYDARTGDRIAELPVGGSDADIAGGVAYTAADDDSDDLVAYDLTDGRKLWRAPLMAGRYDVFSGVIDGGVVVESDGDQMQTLTAYHS